VKEEWYDSWVASPRRSLLGWAFVALIGFREGEVRGGGVHACIKDTRIFDVLPLPAEENLTGV